MGERKEERSGETMMDGCLAAVAWLAYVSFQHAETIIYNVIKTLSERLYTYISTAYVCVAVYNIISVLTALAAASAAVECHSNDECSASC